MKPLEPSNYYFSAASRLEYGPGSFALGNVHSYVDNSTAVYSTKKKHKADRRKEMVPVFQLMTGNNRSLWSISLVNLAPFLHLLFPDPFWLSIPDNTCFPALQHSATQFVHHVGFRTCGHGEPGPAVCTRTGSSS